MFWAKMFCFVSVHLICFDAVPLKTEPFETSEKIHNAHLAGEPINLKCQIHGNR